MTAIEQLLEECTRAGIELRLDGTTVRWRGPRPSPDLLDRLRQNKPAVVSLLQARRHGLTPDQVPWVYVAQQVLAGEFAGAGRSLRESITIGLRSIPHPLCRQALDAIGTRTTRS